MKVTIYGNYKELIPDEGKVLSDGKEWTTAVAAPINADISMWHDIDQPMEDEEIDDSEALQIIIGKEMY